MDHMAPLPQRLFFNVCVHAAGNAGNSCRETFHTSVCSLIFIRAETSELRADGKA